MLACQKENAANENVNELVFTASIQQPAPETKATLEDGLKVAFQVNDKIRVGYPIVGTDGKVTIGGKKDCKCNAGGITGATFTFNKDLPTDESCYYAIYPYQPASPEGYSFTQICNLDPGTSPYEFKANGNIHPVQVAVLNGADPAVLGMIGKAGADKFFRFSQMTSLLKFELKKDGVSKVVLSAGTVEIAGQYNVQGQDTDADGWFDTFTQGTNNADKSATITLLPPVDNKTFPQGTYYIATRPGRNCSAGLKLSFYDGETELKSFSNTSKVQLNRGKVRNLGSFTW